MKVTTDVDDKTKKKRLLSREIRMGIEMTSMRLYYLHLVCMLIFFPRSLGICGTGETCLHLSWSEILSF